MSEDPLESCPFPELQVVSSGVFFELHCQEFSYLKYPLFALKICTAHKAKNAPLVTYIGRPLIGKIMTWTVLKFLVPRLNMVNMDTC